MTRCVRNVEIGEQQCNGTKSGYMLSRRLSLASFADLLPAVRMRLSDPQRSVAHIRARGVVLDFVSKSLRCRLQLGDGTQQR